MTELIEEAIAKVRALPAKEQDAIAAMILEELEDENRWDQTFAGSQNVLAQLASAAMTEHHAGQTIELTQKRCEISHNNSVSQSI